MNHKYYSLVEVAEMLDVRSEMVWAFVQSGQLRSMRLGKRTVRIAEVDLRAFVNELRGVNEEIKNAN